ncbi:MAG: hypothetical protein PHX80_04425 [Candidatus Nanoarchaeia archaeon]|nr:hypothetical protein [Candidatus Nanoarchaeia archaeon]
MFNGKAIYNPKGKAQEYSQWAVNFYNSCSGRCTYCYNNKGITSKILGGDTPTLKKSLVDFDTAYKIFMSEALLNLKELQEQGLHFNFVSDPFLQETYKLNTLAMRFCLINSIPIKVLTKQTWWVDDFEFESDFNGTIWNMDNKIAKKFFAFGFTLTGHNELEPGAATNNERIEAMGGLHTAGFKTWASIEPIIDFESSYAMIQQTSQVCDLYKIGVLSGKKYDQTLLRKFVNHILWYEEITPIYFKDSLLKQAGIDRKDLPKNCVNSDFKL